MSCENFDPRAGGPGPKTCAAETARPGPCQLWACFLFWGWTGRPPACRKSGEFAGATPQGKPLETAGLLGKGTHSPSDLGGAEAEVCLPHPWAGAVTACQLITVTMKNNTRHSHRAVTKRAFLHNLSFYFSQQSSEVNTLFLQKWNHGSELTICPKSRTL